MSKNRLVFRDFSIKKRAIAARRRNREKDDREISEYNGELYYIMEKDYDAERACSKWAKFGAAGTLLYGDSKGILAEKISIRGNKEDKSNIKGQNEERKI